jgi:hypothetical protein
MLHSLSLRSMSDWPRDEKQLRMLNIHPSSMNKVVDDKVWGFLLKLAIALVPLTCSFVIGAFIYIYGTLNRHQDQLTSIVEWRRSQQDIADTSIRRLETVEKNNQERQIELVILREKMTTIGLTTDKSAATLSVMTEQLARIQQLGVEFREKVVNLQVQLDDAKSK